MERVSLSAKPSYLQASSWVAQVLHSFTIRDDKALVSSLRAAEGMPLDKEDVLASGAAVLLSAKDIWAGQGEPLQARREALLKKWQALPSLGGSGRLRHPMGGLRALEFKSKVEELAVWLASIDKYLQPAIWHHQGALQLVGRGFWCPEHLDGLKQADVLRFSADDKVKCLLQAALKSACQAAQARRKRLASQLEADRPQASSAEHAANLVKGSQSATERCAASLSQPARGPQLAMKQLSDADTAVVLAALQDKADTLKLCSQQGSGPSVASGLKAWHHFAVSFLQYDAAETLPPRCPSDVLKFIALFSAAGTAKNYVGYVAWACKYRGLSLEWRTHEVNLALHGLKKAEQVRSQHVLKHVRLMTPDIMVQLIRLCDAMPAFQNDGDLFLLAWQFLLRVQSEAVPLQFGDLTTDSVLPPGRHSAIWVDAQLVCHLRLRKRKHMPGGETCIHFAVRYLQLEALEFLVNQPGAKKVLRSCREELLKLAVEACGVRIPQDASMLADFDFFAMVQENQRLNLNDDDTRQLFLLLEPERGTRQDQREAPRVEGNMGRCIL
eukprot:Skav210206  [mRNA]  locus=scaffold3141:74491:87031:+ [translate_table: standard]